MAPKQRILAIKLSEKLEKHSEYSQNLGITVSYSPKNKGKENQKCLK